MEAAVRRVIVVIILIFVALGVATLFLTPHFYFLSRVEPDQVGIQYSGGRIKGIVPPGVYSDVGLFVNLYTYSIQAFQFSVNDPEVITSDNQRVGVTVSGSVLRPSYTTDAEQISQLWTKYRLVYTDNGALQKVMNDLSTQSMKVCVGNKPFRDSVVGTDRDTLRKCIDEELNGLSKNYGLSVTNLTVPNVTLSPEVQALLDQITKSRLETEKADQDRLKVTAQGAANHSRQVRRGEIKSPTGRDQCSEGQ
jgi:regulator of protease activity HflC (stomatin/prohibitin superfamily)